MKLPVRVELAPCVWLRLAAEAHHRKLDFPGFVTVLLGAEADRIYRERETVAGLNRALDPHSTDLPRQLI
jgi:hypothetical protein